MGLIASFSDVDRAARREVQIAATVRTAAGPQDVALVDLSVTGFRAELEAPLAVGERLTVATRSLGIHEAVVVWTAGSVCGVEFVAPLTRQQVRQAREIDTVVKAQFDKDGQSNALSSDAAHPWHAVDVADPVRRLPVGTRIATIVGLSALGWAGIAAIVILVHALLS